MNPLKLTEPHIFKGYWWIPDNPEKKVAGIVTYTPNERIRLELIGGFEDSHGAYMDLLDDDNSSVSLIYGKDSDAKVITLVGCHGSFSLNFNAGFPMMSYSARMLVYGKHISSIDEVCDYTANVRFPELSYWAQPGVIKQIVNYDAEGEMANSTFVLPYLRENECDIFTCSCENGVNLSVRKGATYNSGELFLKPDIEQFSYLAMNRPGAGMSIPEIFHEIYKFQQILSLATMRNVQYESIDLRDPDIKQDFKDGHKSHCFPIYVLTIQQAVFNPSKISRHNFLFCYEKMPERIPDVLVNWTSDSDKLQPMKHHLVGSMVYKPVVGSVDFLQVVQAIEGVWWRFREADYRTAHNISHGRQTTLSTIISEIKNSLSGIPKVSSMDIDIESVVDSRNYYSHFMDRTKKPKTLDGLPLYTLTEKLRTILLCLILELLGLSHSEINRVVAAHE